MELEQKNLLIETLLLRDAKDRSINNSEAVNQCQVIETTYSDADKTTNTQINNSDNYITQGTFDKFYDDDDKFYDDDNYDSKNSSNNDVYTGDSSSNSSFLTIDDYSNSSNISTSSYDSISDASFLNETFYTNVPKKHYESYEDQLENYRFYRHINYMEIKCSNGSNVEYNNEHNYINDDKQNSIHGDEIVHKWPVNTLLIASDSIFNNLEEKRHLR